MALEIFRLMGSVFVDTDAANKSLQKTDDKASGVGKTLAGGIGTAAKWGTAIAAGAAAGAAALYGMATKSAEAADEIDKMSQKIGVSREAYQELDFILSQNGMDVNSLQGGMKKLVNQMQSAQEGGKTASAAFAALGLSVTDSTGAMKGQEEMFYETIAALQSMENETERNALATDLFGGSATEMLPLLNAGAGSMEELRQKAHDLGLVLDDETIDAGVSFTDTMDQTKRSMEAVVTQVGAQVMPVIEELLQWVLGHMPEIQAVVGAVFNVISAVVSQAGEAVRWLTGIVEEHMPEIQAFVGEAFLAIKDFWDTELKPVLEQIAVFIRDVLAPAFKVVFQNIILPVVKAAFKGITELWDRTLKPLLTGIIDFVTGVFTGNWQMAFEGLLTIVTSIFEGIVTAVKVPINAVIGIVNNFISGLNTLKIPDWVPGVGGKGINIPLIPYLEKGGVLEKGQVGFLEGNGAEAVVPLENNKKWVSAVAADMQSALGGGETEATLEEIRALLQKISDAGIVLDTGALVGNLAGPIDKKLGQISAQKARA